ncbi:hypothetical protein MMC24_005072, partial [Lignoscripta atroalba]|nr:hypothetical protein [Lignoscripta atroalba]
CLAFGTRSTLSQVEPNSSRGTPIPGDYSGSLRPQIHFSPPQGFMNDPNGLFLDGEGTYHLYYQYNPNATVAGNQHWGHATTNDLYHWTNQPIALYPGAPGEGIFSGSAVIDVNNTSGFFPDQTNGVVAIYTLNTPDEETQNIAYSHDGGYTFTKYSQNPVLSINSTQFRDPQVTWYAPTQSWVMVVAYARDLALGIYTSPDLTTWTHASNFSETVFAGLQWECPALVPIPVLRNATAMDPLSPSNFASTDPSIYILIISINPGAPLGGSTTQYFPGRFNGTHFTPINSASRLTDFSKDNYAGQFFYNTPSDAPLTSIAWASNWEYAQTVPTGPLENYRSSMTLPRRNVLANITRAGYDLISLPVDLSPLYTTRQPLASSSNLAINNTNSLCIEYSASIPSGAVYFSINITSIPPLSSTTPGATGSLNFTFHSTTTGERLGGGVFLNGDTANFFLDRSHLRGFPDNPFFTDKFSSVNFFSREDTSSWRVEGVLDRSLLEVFLNGGQNSGTMSFFPEGRLDSLVVGTEGLNEGVEVGVRVWGLESTWAGEGDGEGKGNNGSFVENGSVMMGGGALGG